MKQFFKFMFASIFGTLIALFVAFVASFIIFAIVISAISTEETVSISDNTILEIEVNYSVPEQTTYQPSRDFSFLLPEFSKQLGLNDIVNNIKKAKTDRKIKGIFLNLNNFVGGSYATVNALRNALIDFKESGKILIAHGHRISQKAYYLASVSDKIYMSPTGDLDLRGISMQLTFFKKTLDKLDIEPQIFQAGKYKSAVEIFNRESMSSSNKEQLDAMLDSFYQRVISEIAGSRGIDTLDFSLIMGNYDSRDSKQLVELKLVDGLFYSDQVADSIKIWLKNDDDGNVRKISIHDYNNIPDSSDDYSKNRIAVIYASGEILEGKGDENSIGMENISKELSKVRKNKNVKAVVLRINSPGGSPLTAEIILRETELTSADKPVIASFGEVAASGGYYIAAGCKEIFSDPFSITGSIGAFGIIPNMKNFFDDKLGITFDELGKGKYSGMYTLTRPLNNDEKLIIQNKVDEIYSTFVKRVASGRNMSEEYINEIGQGRVWSGMQAKEIGLVDKLGGLDDAIEQAANLAGIDSYEVVEYPSVKEPFEKIMDLLSTKTYSVMNLFSSNELDELIYEARNYILKRGILTRIPFDIYIN